MNIIAIGSLCLLICASHIHTMDIIDEIKKIDVSQNPIAEAQAILEKTKPIDRGFCTTHTTFPLHTAIEIRAHKALRALIQAGAQAIDNDKGYPLDCALKENNLDAIDELMQHPTMQSYKRFPEKWKKETLFHFAAKLHQYKNDPEALIAFSYSVLWYCESDTIREFITRGFLRFHEYTGDPQDKMITERRSYKMNSLIPPPLHNYPQDLCPEAYAARQRYVLRNAILDTAGYDHHIKLDPIHHIITKHPITFSQSKPDKDLAWDTYVVALSHNDDELLKTLESSHVPVPDQDMASFMMQYCTLTIRKDYRHFVNLASLKWCLNKKANPNGGALTSVQYRPWPDLSNYIRNDIREAHPLKQVTLAAVLDTERAQEAFVLLQEHGARLHTDRSIECAELIDYMYQFYREKDVHHAFPIHHAISFLLDKYNNVNLDEKVALTLHKWAVSHLELMSDEQARNRSLYVTRVLFETPCPDIDTPLEQKAASAIKDRVWPYTPKFKELKEQYIRQLPKTTRILSSFNPTILEHDAHRYALEYKPDLVKIAAQQEVKNKKKEIEYEIKTLLRLLVMSTYQSPESLPLKCTELIEYVEKNGSIEDKLKVANACLELYRDIIKDTKVADTFWQWTQEANNNRKKIDPNSLQIVFRIEAYLHDYVESKTQEKQPNTNNNNNRFTSALHALNCFKSRNVIHPSNNNK